MAVGYLSISNLKLAIIWFMFATSGVVLFEPAPFDLLVIGAAGMSLILGMRIPAGMALPLFLSIIIIFCGFFAAAHATVLLKKSNMHVIVTAYLFVMLIYLGCLVYENPRRYLPIIMNGYTIAVLASCVAGIVGWFSGGGIMYDTFTLYGRAKGTFKDPNVYGPFVVMGAVYALYKLLTAKKFLPGVMWLGVLGISSIGVLLSFSRASWAGLIFTFLLSVIMLLLTSNDPKFKNKVMTLSIVGIILTACILVVIINIDAVYKLLEDRFTLTKDYDSKQGGRFFGHARAFEYITGNFVGWGLNDFGFRYGLNPHNTYLHMFMISGWIGGFAYILLVLSTIMAGFVTILRGVVCRGILIVVWSSFVFIAIEAWIIDIDHWRLFYIQVGIIWGIVAYASAERNKICVHTKPSPE